MSTMSPATSLRSAAVLAGVIPALLFFHQSAVRSHASAPQVEEIENRPVPQDTAPPLTAEIHITGSDSEETATGENEGESGDLPPYDSLKLDTIPSSVTTGANLSTLTGIVREGSSGQPVTAAVVVLRRIAGGPGKRLTTRTDDDGQFRFQGIPSGRYSLDTHHIGYGDRTDTLNVGVKVVMQLEVPVSTKAVELPPMEVTVRQGWLAKTGFYNRKEAGFGKFLTPKDLAKRNAPRMTQVLRQVPGIEVFKLCGLLSCNQMIRFRQTNDFRRCEVTYFMDGREMHGSVSVDNISPQDVAAVEVYRNISETPAEFYGRCGSIVIWSKRAEFGTLND